MRFIDNGDGIVKDATTGLVWQRADDGIQRNWDEAVEYAKQFRLAGHIGWRLPTIDELFLLADKTRYDPAINPIFNCRSSSYWSSSTYVAFPDHAWVVDFSNGGVYANGKSYGNGYVRCVRDAKKEEK